MLPPVMVPMFPLPDAPDISISRSFVVKVPALSSRVPVMPTVSPELPIVAPAVLSKVILLTEPLPLSKGAAPLRYITPSPAIVPLFTRSPHIDSVAPLPRVNDVPADRLRLWIEKIPVGIAGAKV